jgi:NAD(P)H dehydrogenase (quinone)
MTVLVYGATGTQGGPVARQLLDRGVAVRAVTRSADRAARLAAAGAEVVEADLTDPESLLPATKGVDAVFLQVPAGVTSAALVELTRAALLAVRDAGAPHLVLTTSSVVPAAPTGVPYADAKLSMVELVKELVPHAVLLHPGIYLDNLSGPLRPAIEQGVIPYPIPADVPVAWLPADDAAAFAVAALERPQLAGQRFELGGAEALTGPELAALVSTAAGRPVHYQPIPPAVFGEQLAPFMGEQAAREIAAMYEWEGGHGTALLRPVSAETRAALPVTLTPLADWLRHAFG